MDELKASNNFLQYKVEVLQELVFVERCKTEEVEKKLSILKDLVIKEENLKQQHMLQSTMHLLKQIKVEFKKCYARLIMDIRVITSQFDGISADDFSAIWNIYFAGLPLQTALLKFAREDGSICLWQFVEACLGQDRSILQFSLSLADNLDNIVIALNRVKVEEKMHSLEQDILLRNKLIPLWPFIKESIKKTFRNVDAEDVIIEAIQEAVCSAIKQQQPQIEPDELESLSSFVNACALTNSIIIDIDKFILDNDTKFNVTLSKPPPTPARRPMSAQSLATTVLSGMGKTSLSINSVANSTEESGSKGSTPKKMFRNLAGSALTKDRKDILAAGQESNSTSTSCGDTNSSSTTSSTTTYISNDIGHNANATNLSTADSSSTNTASNSNATANANSSIAADAKTSSANSSAITTTPNSNPVNTPQTDTSTNSISSSNSSAATTNSSSSTSTTSADPPKKKGFCVIS